MNTDTVRSLAVTATKLTASDTTQQRQIASPTLPQASIPKLAPPAKLDTRAIEETAAAVAAQLETYLRSIGRSLQFSVDSTTGRTVVSVRDATTGDVIRQIPSEEALRLAQALGSQPSALVDTEA